MPLKSLTICGIRVEQRVIHQDEDRPGVVPGVVEIACEGCGQTHRLFCPDPLAVTVSGGTVVDAYWTD